MMVFLRFPNWSLIFSCEAVVVVYGQCPGRSYVRVSGMSPEPFSAMLHVQQYPQLYENQKDKINPGPRGH